MISPARVPTGEMEASGCGCFVIDDDAAVRTVLQVTMKGCDVVTAVDGREALRVLADEISTPSVVDVMMPHLDGFTVVSCLCRRALHRGTSMVMLTAVAAKRSTCVPSSPGRRLRHQAFDPDEVASPLSPRHADPCERSEQLSRDLLRVEWLNRIEASPPDRRMPQRGGAVVVTRPREPSTVTT